VHQVAYARAVENLTGADLTKLFPSPRIPTEKIPESKPHIEAGLHTKLYRVWPSDYNELAAVWNGSHPETGDPLVVEDQAPEGYPPFDLPAQEGVFAPTTRPKRSLRSPASCARPPACRTSRPASSPTTASALCTRR
jgi:Mn-containing catalase